MVSWIFISGIFAGLAGYTAVAALAAQRLTHPRRRFPNATPGAVGLAYEEVLFPARDERIAIAAWYLPARGATRVVIVAHGVGGCRSREFTLRSHDLMAYLVRHGFSVLVLDLRGHGQSDLAPMTFGIHERRDLLGAVDWLLARGYAPGAIGVLGASMGGVAGIGAAGEEPAIGALIIDSACADFLAMMRKHFRAQAKLPTFFLPGALFVAHLLTGARLAKLRPADNLRAISQRPVLIIHAQGDQLVPIEHAQELARAGKAELWITQGISHLGSFRADPPAYSERVARFFEAALAGADQPMMIASSQPVIMASSA
jgi:uncharacterized protein